MRMNWTWQDPERLCLRRGSNSNEVGEWENAEKRRLTQDAGEGGERDVEEKGVKEKNELATWLHHKQGLVWRGGIFTLRHSPFIFLLLNPTPCQSTRPMIV